MGESSRCDRGHAGAVLDTVVIGDVRRTFWWDAGRPADAAVEPLRAVLFDLDGAWTDTDDVAPRHGLDDLVNSLFFAGVAIAVVSTGSRDRVEPLVREAFGEGIAHTVVTPDDLNAPGRDPDLHAHALWELGVGSEAALAVTSSARGLRAAAAAKVATLVVSTPHTAGQDFAGAAGVRGSYDGLLVSGCEVLHRRWWRDR